MNFHLVIHTAGTVPVLRRSRLQRLSPQNSFFVQVVVSVFFFSTLHSFRPNSLMLTCICINKTLEIFRKLKPLGCKTNGLNKMLKVDQSTN